jgi:hypothetical protein
MELKYEDVFEDMSKDEFKAKFPKLSNTDVDFYFPEKKLLNFENEYIGVRKYNQLINKRSEFNNYNFTNPDKPKQLISEFENLQIEKFESVNQQSKKEGFQNEIEYWDKVHTKTNKKKEFINGLLPDKKTIYKNFLIAYKYLNDVDFIINDESIKNIEPIIKYFSFDKTFFDCENSIKKIGNKNLTPSFDKGLLLIGNVGNGKTSVMNSIGFMVDYFFEKSISENWDTAGDWKRLVFKFKTAESLVTEYEFISSGSEKETFFSKYSKGNLLIDDLKREKNASNFGITNVVKAVIEKRYNNQKHYSEEKSIKYKTFGTMNFHENFPNDIDLAIQECGVRYGAHIYDRMFEMFNIIEFKGKSFRN